MRQHDRLSASQIAGWGMLGALTGLAIGVALGTLAGDVNRDRLTRVARRLRDRQPPSLSSAAAAARAARVALEADALLGKLGIDVVPVSPHAVELRGWVPTRSARAAAARMVRGVAGIDKVINNILVRGEDDRALPEGSEPTNQTA